MIDYAARRTTMVDTQVRPCDVTKFPVIDAMLRVERELFVPREKREAAYIGENVVVPIARIRAPIADAKAEYKNKTALDTSLSKLRSVTVDAA